MSRFRARGSTISVSLFPFLAVLLCTMGALILLLIIISRTARAQAKSIDAEDAVPVVQDLEAERELLELRIEQLTQQRDETQNDLRRRQLELGHLEVEAQKMRAQLDELIALRDQLANDDSLSAQARTEMEFELARRQAEIASKRLELDQLMRDRAGKPPAYAVVPYQGPHGTRRPPMYIECQADSIVLQPEGIILTERDFEGPLGPGNPLAAAMRATREHMARQRRSSDGETGEPYPMLLVRPDGIDAYWVAREALQSWGTDFGYELVDADWDLSYRDRDSELERQVTQAVDVAREQQRLLAQMAPRSFGRSERVFRANPTGGGVIADGRGGRGNSPGGTATRSGRSAPRGFGSDGDGGGPTRGADGGLMPPEHSLDGRGGFARGGGAEGRHGGSDHAGDSYAGMAGGEYGDSFQGGADGSAMTQANPYARQGDSQGSTSSQAGSPSGSPLDTAGQMQSGAAPHSAAPPGPTQSMAQRRGKNWGVPDAVRGATPITRPILLQCREDSISIMSDDGRMRPIDVISFVDTTEESVDPLIAAVWRQIDRWGIAGHGMYWHPILVLDVQRDGQQRADDLESLLADSGIEIQRRGNPRVAGPAGTGGAKQVR